MGLATRVVYGNILSNELCKNKNIVVLDADLGNATKSISFKKVVPQRYFDMGIAEQNMIGTAAGLAVGGKIPLASTFAVFATGRAFEQIRNSIAYPKLNVKIMATHAGLTVGEDGGSHQAVEDMALMRSLPNMVVINPADAREAEAAIRAAIDYEGPVYVRLGRADTEDIHDEEYKFVWGKGEVLCDGRDVGIIATGIMTAEALKAAAKLSKLNISARIINIHTLKPLDKELVIETARLTGKIITAEEHSIIGGLGSAVSEVLGENYPVKIKRIGIQDSFGESGTPNELLKKYGLTAEAIVEAGIKICSK